MRNPKSAKVGLGSGLPSVVWVLLGLLLAASALFLFARSAARSFPSIESTLPSGAAVFAELLRREGFEVVLDTDDDPDLPKDALVIAYFVPVGFFGGSNEYETKALAEWVEGGGVLLGLTLSADFDDASRAAQAREASNGAHATLALRQRITVSQTAGSSPTGSFPTAGDEALAIRVLSDDSPLVVAGDRDKGVIVEVGDALGSTNRFIDKEQNAAFYLDLVRAVAPGKKVVFVEALFGNTRNVGLLARLGSWASAAWWQFLLFAIVVTYTLGKRFGLPERDRRTQRGARELVDAFADTMNRGRQRQLALSLIAADVELRLRRLLALDVDADERELSRHLPADLAAALAEAKDLPEKLPPAQGARIARRLVGLCDDFERERRQTGTRSTPIR